MLLPWLRSVTVTGLPRVCQRSKKPCQASQLDQRFQRSLSGSKVPEKPEANARKDSSAPKIFEDFVLLHNDDGKVIGSRSLQVATEIAQRRKMGLMKIEGPPGVKKEWYKLVPMKELVKTGTPQKSSETKTIQMTTTIAENDLKTKAKKAAKWISQNLEVRVLIAGNMQSTTQQLKSVLEQFLSLLADTPHECSPMKPSAGVLKVSLRPRKGAKAG